MWVSVAGLGGISRDRGMRFETGPGMAGRSWMSPDMVEERGAKPDQRVAVRSETRLGSRIVEGGIKETMKF